MEFPDNYEAVIAGLARTGRTLMALEVPVPDLALICAFLLIIVAMNLALRSRLQESSEQLQTLYQAELLTANRRTTQVEGELRKARLDIERERQKRRKEARVSPPRRTGPTSSVAMRDPEQRLVVHG